MFHTLRNIVTLYLCSSNIVTNDHYSGHTEYKYYSSRNTANLHHSVTENGILYKYSGKSPGCCIGNIFSKKICSGNSVTLHHCTKKSVTLDQKQCFTL